MKIHQMLNPSLGEDESSSQASTPASLRHTRSTIIVSKPKKIPKDAPIFSDGTKVVGIVNFPPHEAGGDTELVAQHRKFQIYPLGEIHRKGVRHIPYNSDKKDFLEKTGRDAFEIFQYTFKRPGDEKEYVVVWDYNVGLVRVTPFFKSCKYSKTTPAKALRENSGLMNISYSITGGALVCQGYWVPYHAAKAMAATFCHDIRWALTPVFGNDFPSSCIHPKDSAFGKFLINPSIVQYCSRETTRFRAEGDFYRRQSCKPSPKVSTKTHFRSPSWNIRVAKDRRMRSADVESGYGTDTSPEKYDKHLNSPQVSPRSQRVWTSVNDSQLQSSPRTANSSALTSPRGGCDAQHMRTMILPKFRSHQFLRTKRTLSKVTISEENEEEQVHDNQSTTDVESGDEREAVHVSGTTVHSRSDIDAAEVLMSLSAGRNMVPPPKRTRRGSKY